MESRTIELRPGRAGIEKLEPRIAPTIVMVNGAGNTPRGEAAENGQAIEFRNPAGRTPAGWEGEDVLLGDNASIVRAG